MDTQDPMQAWRPAKEPKAKKDKWKNIVIAVLSVALVVSIASNGSAEGADVNSAKQSTSATTQAATKQSTKETTAKPTTTPKPTSSPQPTATPIPEATTAMYASRKNPAKIGDSVNVTGRFYGVDIEYEISLRPELRGEAANKRAISDNQFNDWSENEELIYYTVDFELLEYSPEDDEPYYLSSWSFDTYTSNYSQYRTDTYIFVEDEVGGDIYEGGSQSGSIVVILPEGEGGYLVFDDWVWFEIPAQ